jgi:CheY-like chemotaxis protein
MAQVWKVYEIVMRADESITDDPGPQLRVLVVEDHREAAHNLAALLRLDGHTVQVAYSGPEGVELGSRWRPDVVLLDLGLPGIDGWEVATLLRAEVENLDAKTEKQPLIIAISGNDGDSERLRSAEAGIALHLGKPADPDKLRAFLRRFTSVLK